MGCLYRSAVFALVLIILSILMSPLSSCSSLPEDLNQDGTVDINDVVIVTNAYGSRAGSQRWHPMADLTDDELVDILDVVRITRMFGMCIPVASFTKSFDVAIVGVPVEFDPSESSDSDGTITRFEWDWDGDGVYEEETETATLSSHAYVTVGEYNVTLRVTDNDGLIDKATIQITVISNQVIPEVPLGTLLISALLILAVLAYFTTPRLRSRMTPSGKSK